MKGTDCVQEFWNSVLRPEDWNRWKAFVEVKSHAGMMMRLVTNSHMEEADGGIIVYAGDPRKRKARQLHRIGGQCMRQVPRAEIAELGHPVHHTPELAQRDATVSKHRHQDVLHVEVGHHTCSGNAIVRTVNAVDILLKL